MADPGLVAELINPKYVVSLCKYLIQFRTENPPGNEALLAGFLLEEFRRLGLEGEVYPLTEGRASVVGRWPARDDLGDGVRPRLVYSAHLDVVPAGEGWTTDPWQGTIVPGRIAGRGAADMKGALAAMVAAAGALARSRARLDYDVVFAFTAGEEVDSCGAVDLVERGVLEGTRAVVVGEPTDLEVACAEKGALWLELEARGVAAHGSMPELGKNAILRMLRALEAVERMDLGAAAHPLLGRPSLSLGTIAGGTRTNVVPDRCLATLDLRTVPGMDHGHLVQGIREAAARAVGPAGGDGPGGAGTRGAGSGGTGSGGAGSGSPDAGVAVRVLLDRPPVETDPGHPLVRLLMEVASDAGRRVTEPVGVPYFSDGAVYGPRLGAPVVLCGPGHPAQAHKANEGVSIDNLVHAARVYAALAVRFGEILA